MKDHVSAFDAPDGSVWRYHERIYMVLPERRAMYAGELYRRYMDLGTGGFGWFARTSLMNGDSAWIR